MDDTAKYLIHARIAANGVVERSDVVGAVFGQTEGLLGDGLDLRDLQQSSKVGRIDVEISSENGQSFGELMIATSLDKAETAVLGASLETIERVGPCQATIEVTSIEDVRAAKRREVVDRAKELLATAFDETVLSSEELLADVRASVQVEAITEYAGLPAGPSVASSDAIIIVEGRADVVQLLEHGIKNAIAVEGTNVPEAVAELTADRTATVFVDGDRGGELILRELLQVADIEHVVFAPAGQSVEDLSRETIHSLLREKIAADRIGDTKNIRETITGLVETGGTETTRKPSTDSETATAAESTESATPAESTESATPAESTEPATAAESTETATAAESTETATPAESTETATPAESTETATAAESTEPATAATESATELEVIPTSGDSSVDTATGAPANRSSTPAVGSDSSSGSETGFDPAVDTPTETETEPQADPNTTSETADDGDESSPSTLRRHVRDVIDAESGRARLLSESFGCLAELEPSELLERLETAEPPFAVVLDGELSQAVLDVAAQRGVDHIVARSTGDFVKQPVGTRVLTAEQLRADTPDVTV